MNIKKRIHGIRVYLSVFSTPFDAWKFRKLWTNTVKETKSPIFLHVKEAKNHTLLCRPNSSDAGTLWSTFYDKYHIPPIDLGENSTIVDLGSNVGYTMVHLACLYPKARVYGVEMDSNNFSVAKKNISFLKERCKIIQAAVWSENGEIHYGGTDANGFSIFNKTNNNNKTEKAPAKTLDKIIEEFGLTKIDFLKMDIEGAEKAVLENITDWIKIVRSMKIEIHKPANIDDCMDILRKHGFECQKDTHHPSCIIAIKNNLK